MEHIIAGGSGSTVPRTCSEDEGSQTDMSGDGNDKPEHIIAGGSGSTVPRTYTEDEVSQTSMSRNGDEKPEHGVADNAEQDLAVMQGSGEPSASMKRNKTRGRTQIMEGKLHITKVTEGGQPIAPEKVARKFVSQCGAIVRDNVPISIREWRGKINNPYALPQTQKDMLWADVKNHFTLPEGVDETVVKHWTLRKMATQFQSFKKNLDTNFIKKGRTPNFNDWPKLRDHWNSFVEYKMSESSANRVRVNSTNANKKEYHHRLGQGGYMSAIPKWKKMENDLLERGIVPATLEWPDRSKNWYFAHGGNLSPEDGTLVFNETIRQKALRLIQNVEDAKSGKLKVDRENDELTLALGNLEHPGRCRGFGVVPWKFAFRSDIDTYRSRKRRKEQQEECWRHMLEAKMNEQEARMREEINRQVVLAVTSMVQSGALPNSNIANPSECQSRCASTGVPDEEMPRLPVVAQDNERYLVDDITRRTSCELHKPLGNLTIKVAYGSAFPILPGQTNHDMDIPPGYSSVGLEQICDIQYEGLELDLPGGCGERTLGDALHGIILWPKRYIVIPGKEASLLPLDPPQPSSPQNSRPSYLAHPSPASMSKETRKTLLPNYNRLSVKSQQKQKTRTHFFQPYCPPARTAKR